MPKSTPTKSTSSKRKARDRTPGSRFSRRQVTNDFALVTPTDSTVTQSEEEAFRRRNAAEFGEVFVKVEDETDAVDVAPSEAPRVVANRTASLPAARDVHQTAASRDSALEHDDRQSILDSILIEWPNAEMTQHAVNQVLQDARNSAGFGTDFGITHVEDCINRLKRKSIAKTRLAELVGLLQKGLQEHFTQFRARVESLGRAQSSPSLLSETPQADTDKHHATEVMTMYPKPKPGSSQALYVEVAPTSKEELAKIEASRCSSDGNSASSSDEDQDVSRSSQKNSTYQDDDDEEYRDCDNPGEHSETPQLYRGTRSMERLDTC